MYADVVVLTYQSPDLNFYTYKVPKDLEKAIKIGQLVSVPFGKRSPQGVIVKIRRDPGEIREIREIREILLNQPVLLPYQIELLGWMAFYYRAPMVNCLKAILPVEALNAKRLTTNANNFSVERSALSVQQTLVLVPSINRLPETLAKYREAKNYVIYHNELGTREKFAVWQKILSGTVNYIFGSRSAIFTPCPALSKIIIHDEHEPGYKDERSPYFDTLTVAEKISELTGCKIQIIDTSPKVTTYYLAQKHPRGEISLHLGGEKTDPKPKVQIVSMLDEKAAGNKSPISDVLENYIKKGFQKNKKMLLFLNKKIESGHLYCRACKHNQYLTTGPETCPNCGSADIWFSSLNVQSLAALVGKIVPQAKVNIIAEGYQLPATSNQQPVVDIATAAVFYKLATQKYDLTVHVAADTILNIADFSSTEKAYFQITNLKKVTRGLLLIQTYNRENSTLNLAANDNYQAFFNSQIKERKALSYPPFAQLIKLTLKGKKEEELQKKSQELFDDLIHSPFTINLSILGPYKSTASTATAKYNIIAKIPVSSYSLAAREKAVDKARPFLLKVPRNWQIEVEPESLL